MRLLLLVLLSALSVSACGEVSSALPTAPSLVAPAFEVSGTSLSWQLADGCVLQKPALPTSIIGTEPSSVRVVSAGELWAQWPEFSSSAPACISMGSGSEVVTVSHYPIVTFVQQEGRWHFCQWDTLVKKTIELRDVPCSDREVP